jgi:hypothetical protein
VLSPLEVRRIQEIIAAAYCMARPADTKRVPVGRIVPPAPTGAPMAIPRTAEGRSRLALATTFVQLPH